MGGKARAGYYEEWKENKLEEDPDYFNRIQKKHREKRLREDPEEYRSEVSARVRKHYKHNSAVLNEKARQKRIAQPELHRKKDFTHNLKRFGLSVDDFFKIYHKQNESCAICGLHNDDPKYARSLHIDHCHKTGIIRGLLCHGCNTGIGAFSEEIEVMEKAISYLKDRG